jgi:predicted RecA/RadA family phage recombinase
MTIKGNPVPTTVHQQGFFKVSDGKSVRVTVPASSEYKAGQLVLIDGFLGFITRDVKTAAGETVEAILAIEVAEYETDQIDATKDFDKGDKIYWDASTSKLTTDAKAVFAGVVTAAKDTNNVIWFVLWPGFVADTSLEVIGELGELATTHKTSIVDAVNEVNTNADAAQADASTALARVAANVTCAENANAEAVRTALIALLGALETAGLMLMAPVE